MTKFVKDIQPKLIFEVGTEADRRWAIDRSNPANPFHSFVGNDDVINKILRLAYSALGREDHRANEVRLAFLGPAGTGKTTVANKLAELLDLPFANVNPSALRTTHDLFVEIAKAAAGVGFEHTDGKITTLALRPQQDDTHFTAPPMVVFIDEVHLLKSEVEQGLLTATDGAVNDLATNQGVHLDTSNITWVIATTESGKLFHALKTRFSKAQFKNYSPAQIAGIVQANTGLPAEVCERAAFFSGRVTREAIDFAKEVALEQAMSGGSWADAVEVIRLEHGIDELGMELRRLNILKAVGAKGPLSQARLLTVARCQIEELRDEVLPPLMEFGEGTEPLIVVSSKGYQITQQGKDELGKRGLEATAKAA